MSVSCASSCSLERPVLLAYAACQLQLELVDHVLEQRHLGVAIGDHAQQRVDGQVDGVNQHGR